MENNTQNNQEMNTDAPYGFHSLKGILSERNFSYLNNAIHCNMYCLKLNFIT